MSMFVAALFVLGAVFTAVMSLASMLLSPKPADLCGHVQSLARLGVFGGSVVAAGRVVVDGGSVTTERAVLMASLAILYLIQTRAEVLRQRRGGKA
jgi:hypothetical protein